MVLAKRHETAATNNVEICLVLGLAKIRYNPYPVIRNRHFTLIQKKLLDILRTRNFRTKSTLMLRASLFLVSHSDQARPMTAYSSPPSRIVVSEAPAFVRITEFGSRFN